MDQQKIYTDIANKLSSAKKILLTTHENPDGDALGSLVAMYDYLLTQDKQCFLFCYNLAEHQFQFLPHSEKIIEDKNKIPFAEFDLVIMLDCASLHRSRIGDLIKKMNLPIINIDHHISNEKFGDINLIDAKAVSTTQILYDFFKSQKIVIKQNMATGILTGILTDSGNFAYTTTTSHTFNIASEMLTSGANVRSILNATKKRKDLPTLQIWGLALNRLQYNSKYDVAYTVLTQDDIKEFNINMNDLEGLASFLNTLKNAKAVLVLTELDDGRVKGSFRTNRNDVDVSKFAQAFGGGGHQKAAGFEIRGKLQQTDQGWTIV